MRAACYALLPWPVVLLLCCLTPPSLTLCVCYLADRLIQHAISPVVRPHGHESTVWSGKPGNPPAPR
jgi:hypothetical protein